MGWDPIKDIKKAFKKLDDDWNLSDTGKKIVKAPKEAVEDVLTLGTTREMRAQKSAEKEAIRRGNAVRLQAQRNTNFRGLMQSYGSTQQEAAQLMAMAAAGGFTGSAIEGSLSSAKSQTSSTEAHINTMDVLGREANKAAVDQWNAQRRYQTQAMILNFGAMVGLKAFGL